MYTGWVKTDFITISLESSIFSFVAILDSSNVIHLYVCEAVDKSRKDRLQKPNEKFSPLETLPMPDQFEVADFVMTMTESMTH